MPSSQDCLHKQIADAERAIWMGDDRRQQIKDTFMQTAKRRLRASNTTWVIGGLVLAGAVWALYPKRRALMGVMGTVLRHPIGMSLLQGVPLSNVWLPWVSRMFLRP